MASHRDSSEMCTCAPQPPWHADEIPIETQAETSTFMASNPN